LRAAGLLGLPPRTYRRACRPPNGLESTFDDLAQYCSLNNPKSFGVVHSAGVLPLSRTQIVVTHFAFYATGVDSVATGNHPLFKQFVQDGFMEHDPLLRGE